MIQKNEVFVKGILHDDDGIVFLGVVAEDILKVEDIFVSTFFYSKEEILNSYSNLNEEKEKQNPPNFNK